MRGEVPGVSSGTRKLPVLVTLTRDENWVVVVVRTLCVEMAISVEEMRRETVGKEVVKRAFVIVVTGKGAVSAGTVKREMVPPDAVEKGFSPPRMLKGPDSSRREAGLLTVVHRIRALLLD
jgi:hypothetical protein